MTAVAEHADHRLLMDRTPVSYAHVQAGTDLACLVRGGSDARRILRAAYAELRGTIMASSVSDQDIETLFARLAEWDISSSLSEALLTIHRLFLRMGDYVQSGGLRRGELGAMHRESKALSFAAVYLGALKFAVQWRVDELSAGQEPGSAGVAGQEPAGAAVAAETTVPSAA